MDKMFNELLKKKMGEQKESPVDPKKLEAKAEVIKQLMQKLKEVAGSDLQNGLKKVTVASDSPEGLAAGLEKAKELTSEEPEMEDEMEGEDSNVATEGEDHEIAELEKKLAELKAKKQMA